MQLDRRLILRRHSNRGRPVFGLAVTLTTSTAYSPSTSVSATCRAGILKGLPLNRLGNAEDAANIYLFLSTDLSAYVTGA